MCLSVCVCVCVTVASVPFVYFQIETLCSLDFLSIFKHLKIASFPPNRFFVGGRKLFRFINRFIWMHSNYVSSRSMMNWWWKFNEFEFRSFRFVYMLTDKADKISEANTKSCPQLNQWSCRKQDKSENDVKIWMETTIVINAARSLTN